MLDDASSSTRKLDPADGLQDAWWRLEGMKRDGLASVRVTMRVDRRKPS